MSSVFAETVVEYISDYRTVLRKSLPQAERMLRLKRLNLKSITVYSDDVELYNTSIQILEDIDANGKIPEQGYYSYSGLQNFQEKLRTFITQYAIVDKKVINRSQYTSTLLLDVIQMINTPGLQQADELQHKLLECNILIVYHGSNEQRQLYLGCLERLANINQALFMPVLDHFTEHMEKHEEKEEAA